MNGIKMSDRYLIIADDFTGANDTGVQLKRRGIDTNVVFSNKLINTESCSFVIDTESRSKTEEEAYNIVKNILKGVDLSKFKYIIKKVDSTLRGNIAWEVKAVDEAYKSEIVIFTPALPDFNRTTVYGIHMLNNVPISETEMARDPLKPVKEDNITKLLEKVYNEEVIHISLDEIQNNQMDFTKGRIFTCDAVTNDDLKSIIKTAIQTEKRILWVGASAIADNLFEIEKATRPVLSIISSVSNVTRSQVKYAENKGITLIKIPFYDILENKIEPKLYIEKTCKLLEEGEDVILLSSSSYSIEEYEKTNNVGNQLGLSKDEISSFINKIMGFISKEVLLISEVSGVFLTGGETAISFFNNVESLGSSIIQEIAVGIPIMRLMGGPLDGLKVVTKAGAFGDENAITYSIRKLKEVL